MKFPIIGRVWPYISAFAKTLLAAADATAARILLGVTPATLGGTGVANNVASTLTISGSFGTTITVTGATTVTLPTTGTLLSNTTKIVTTLITEQFRLAYDATFYITGTVASNGRTTFDQKGGGAADTWKWTNTDVSANDFMQYITDNSGGALAIGVGANARYQTNSSGNYSSAVCRYGMGGYTTGISDGNAADTVGLRSNGTDIFLVNATTATIASGITLKFGATAAAAIAVASTHKIASKDATGTTYYLLATTVP